MLRVGYILILLHYTFTFAGAQPVKDAYMDVSVWQGREILRLDGEWKMHFGKFLHPDSVEEAEYILFSNPGVWNGLVWKGKPIPAKGYATFWVDVEVPDDWSDFALKISTFGTAGRVYINGELVHAQGVVGTSEATSVPEYRIGFEHFNRREGIDKVTIVAHVSNFHYSKGGIWNSFFLGTSDAMVKKMHLDHMVDAFLLGVFVIMALYHLALYWMRPKENFTLYFAILCIIIFLRTLSSGDYFINQIFPGLPWVYVIKIEFVTFYLSASWNVLFINSLFREETPKWLYHTLLWPGVVLSAICLVFSPEINSYFIRPYQIFLILAGISIIYILVRAIIHNRNGAWIYLFGLSLAFATVINDILYFNYLIRSFIMIHIGVFFYIFSLSFLVARRYSNAMNEVEELTDQLSLVNKELELKVEKRTEDIRQQNELINEQNSELKKLYAEQRNFLAVVAHDLKAPFNKILGLLSLIDLTGKLNKEQKEAYDHLTQVAEDGRTLILDLTNLNSFEHPDLQPTFEEFDLKKILTSIINDYKKAANEKNILLNVSIAAEELTIYSDKQLLKRIVDNLLSNAIKFSPRGKNVYIEAELGDESFIFRIKDEGPGFSEKDKEKLYHKFQKLSAQPTAGESSTGLGLSIVKTLTDRLNGKIELATVQGEGSTFTLTFPMRN